MTCRRLLKPALLYMTALLMIEGTTGPEKLQTRTGIEDADILSVTAISSVQSPPLALLLTAMAPALAPPPTSAVVLSAPALNQLVHAVIRLSPVAGLLGLVVPLIAAPFANSQDTVNLNALSIMR